MRPIRGLRSLISEALTRAGSELFGGWNSQARMGSSRKSGLGDSLRALT